ncbi:MAG: hypothetical protein KDA61_15545, partial [Planctomycetales bacterium]|nr:hypothetical protein [Planctomycetales bacterium]
FVCVLDDEGDGHEHARRAVARGAAAVVCERQTPVFHVPQYHVADSRVALGQIAHFLAGDPSRAVKVIGVTGSHGKTSTLEVLEAIFAADGKEVGVVSDAKIYDGMTRGPGAAVPLSPNALASKLARMDAAGLPVALVELSSVGLSRRTYAGVNLDALCVTHVTSADLQVHGSVQNHRDASRRALDLLGGEGAAVLNGDDPVCCDWLGDFGGPVLTFSTQSDSPIAAQIIERHANETVFLLTAGHETAAVRSSVLGDHFVDDCLAAAATALLYGVPLTTIAKGIESVARLSGKMERVDLGQGFPLFVDSADSPESLRCVLRTARQISEGRVLCVLGDQPPRADFDAEAVRSVVGRMADVAIVTDARAERDCFWHETSDDACTVHQAVDRGEAIAWAVSMARPGDVVVVTGSRGRDGVGFGQKPQEPTDRELAHAALDSLAVPRLRLAA